MPIWILLYIWRHCAPAAYVCLALTHATSMTSALLTAVTGARSVNRRSLELLTHGRESKRLSQRATTSLLTLAALLRVLLCCSSFIPFSFQSDARLLSVHIVGSFRFRLHLRFVVVFVVRFVRYKFKTKRNASLFIAQQLKIDLRFTKRKKPKCSCSLSHSRRQRQRRSCSWNHIKVKL